MRTETRGATERQETLILMLNKTAEPFTDGIARRLVATCSGLDAVLDRVGNQIMAESELDCVAESLSITLLPFVL